MTQPPETMASAHPTDGTRCANRDKTAVDHPQRRCDVIRHELDGEALLFDPETQSTHRLNETGLLIWASCDGATTIDDIALRLADRYAVDRDEAQSHVSRLVRTLRRQRLLVGSREKHLRATVPDGGIGTGRGTA